ncbi:MAG: tetratricopeptide repeat protein [Pseudomonadota bacterium]
MSDILSEEEDLARLKSWWGEYGNTILLSVGIAVVVIIGWRWWQSNEAAGIAAASDAYQAYVDAPSEEKPAQLGALSEHHNGTAYYAFALLDQAKIAVDEGDLSAAQGHLVAAIDAAPHDLLADLARLRLARVLRGLDQNDAAIGLLNEIGTEGYIAWALETKGDIHASLGEVSLAHEAYQAAKANLQDDLERPILNLKLDNVAPYNGSYVKFESGLAQALSEAQKTLAEETSGEESLSADVDATETDAEGAAQSQSEQIESEQGEVEQTTD